MTYLAHTIFNMTLLLVCGVRFCQTLSRFEALYNLQESLIQTDAEFMSCAQRKANFRNIEDSYLYLLKRFPELEEELDSIKESFLEHHENLECTHSIYKDFHASIHRQNNKTTAKDWPNWILSTKEYSE